MDGPSAFLRVSEPGKRQQISAAALGKAISAFVSVTEVDQVLNYNSLTCLTARTISKRKILLREWRSVRYDPLALDTEESMVGGQCVASPGFDRTSSFVAAIGVSGPQIRMAKQISEARTEVREAAIRISELLWIH